jgi:hypothetical protein
VTDASGQTEDWLVVVPMRFRAEVMVTDWFVGPLLPWQSPALQGAHFHPVDDPTSKQLVIVSEWPIPHWAVISDRLPQETVERMHLDRYCTDQLIRTGNLPYASLVPGANPPDFKAIDAHGKSVGVDATRLTTSGRIGAQEQFERIRRALLEEPRVDFAHLRGHLIHVWFMDDAGDIGLPHRKPHQVHEVIQALRGYTPEVSWTNRPGVVKDGMPEELGETDIQKTPSGCSFYARELLGATPSTSFFAATGFELALSFQSEHAHDAAWTELARLVARHDKPEIDHLIVTVSGPNERGLSYPSEAVLLDAALGAGTPSLQPSHLSQVVLHSWTDGRVIEVYPAPARAAGPLYPGGYMSPYYSLIAPATTPDTPATDPRAEEEAGA